MRKNKQSKEVQEVRPVNIKFKPDNDDYIPKSEDRDIEEKADDEVLSAREDIYASNDAISVIMEILDWAKYILIAIILGLVISQFVLQRSEVVGRSMESTLHNEDQLLVDKISLYFTDLKRGEIVTVNSAELDYHNEDEGLLVKRIVALPGETIDFKEGKVLINGEVLAEPYLTAGTYTEAPYNWAGPYTVEADHYFVLGDNRGNSADSRVFGSVNSKAIEGKVWIRILPIDQFGTVD